MAKKDLRRFDYKELANLDTEMWRAYYAHQFGKLFRLLIKLMRLQFGFSTLLALRAAYYAAVAAADYRIHARRENFPRVQKRLEKLYKLLNDNVVTQFDYKKAAEIELEWWNIHRYPERYKKKLHVSLAEGAASIYNGDPKDFMKYGEYRAEAMKLRDMQQYKPDWPKIEALLNDSWKSLHAAVRER